jgi:glycosyltransferase involved in cell wall biosynthesis
MAHITVIVPTCGRPHHLGPLVGNILTATRSNCDVVVVAEADDDATRVAAANLDQPSWLVINDRVRSYTGALNAGYVHARGDYVVNGSDDLWFDDDWDVPALAVFAARPELRVVGTNDLGNPAVLQGLTATSYLIDRRYLDEVGGVIDQPPGVVQYEGYDHNFTDTEFVATAQARGVFAPCLDSVVEHRHFVHAKAPWDEGYARSHRHAAEDGAIFESRRHLWEQP